MEQSTITTMFSHNSDEWATPWELFNKLKEKFPFTLDACATKENTKCEKYFTIEDDGLKQDWGGNVVFVNPPYSDVKSWMQKSYEEGLKDNTTVLLLIPARTDTKAFHKFCTLAQKIYFVKGRIKFLQDNKTSSAAPFPSMIVLFNKWRDLKRGPLIDFIDPK